MYVFLFSFIKICPHEGYHSETRGVEIYNGGLRQWPRKRKDKVHVVILRPNQICFWLVKFSLPFITLPSGNTREYNAGNGKFISILRAI